MLKSLPAIALLATTVLADSASIIAAIVNIDNQAFKLNNTILGWKGAPQGFLRLQKQSNVTLAAINNGTAVAEASEPLDFNGAIDIATATLPLIDDLNITLISFINAQSKFAALCKLPDALAALQAQKDASDAFSAAVVEKVPSDLQEAASQIVAPIDDYFNVAVKNYTAAVAQQKKNPKWKGWNGQWGTSKYGKGLACHGKPPKPTKTPAPYYPKPTHY